MQRIHLLCVGSVKTSFIETGCAEYFKRLKCSCQFDVTEIPASKKLDPAAQMNDESERLLKACEKLRGQIWVLDEHGEQMTSVAFSGVLGVFRDRGESITFIVGGAYGLTDDVRARADTLFSLSSMTLSHELCRLVFMEQLYRAFDILKGGDYHH